MSKPAYKRVLLKLSGEALSGEKGFGINNEVVKIANFFNIQVIGKMAIYKSDILGYMEKDVITDIAFLDASGNVIV